MASKLSVLMKAKQIRNSTNDDHVQKPSINYYTNLDSNIQDIINDFDYMGTNIKIDESVSLDNFINNLQDNNDENSAIDVDVDLEQIINSYDSNDNNDDNDDNDNNDNNDNNDIKQDNLNKSVQSNEYIQLYHNGTDGFEHYSGPYEYKLFFEDKAYPHSVNLNKLIFNYKFNDKYYSKILYLSTGHSFAENTYQTDQGLKITKTDLIDNVFAPNGGNLFYSLDKGFDDFALISFGETKQNDSNKLDFEEKTLNISSVCKNMDIKFLENETFIKNGNNIGETWAKTLINFQTDSYLQSTSKNFNFYTFKINGKIVIVQTKYPSGIVLKGINSRISKYNSEPITEEKNNEQLSFYFSNILKEFSNHEIFSNILLDEKLLGYYTNYKNTNSLTIVSLMGDSGSGFYRIIDNENLEFVGINIGSCSMMVLKQSDKKYPNKLMWNNSINKLVFGGYIIEEIHKSCQMLPVNDVQNLITRNLPNNILLKEITV